MEKNEPQTKREKDQIYHSNEKVESGMCMSTFETESSWWLHNM